MGAIMPEFDGGSPPKCPSARGFFALPQPAAP
jgi:hypothetical protein